MNELTRKISDTYKAQLALIVYKSTIGHEAYYIESRPIQNGQMGAGAPLTENTLNGIKKMLTKKKKNLETTIIGGVIPECMVYFSRDSTGQITMIWYRKPEKRNMLFKEELKISDGQAMVPGLVYVAKGSGLTVFALASSKKPVASTKLYQPPFHNCSDNGSVCLGSARAAFPDRMTYDALIKYYENLFWGSRFSHTGRAAAENDVTAIWKNQIANPELAFDVKLLKSAKLQFKSLLK